MKRINNLFQKICSLENLQIADEKAQKGKQKQYGVQLHNKNRDANLMALRLMLVDKTYKTSKYSTFQSTIVKENERLEFT